MKYNRSILFFIILIFSGISLFAQHSDTIYNKNIATVQLYPGDNQLALPILNLASGETAQLHFDDLDGDVKNYYYTYELCNSDWQPVNVGAFDFLKGFTQTRINNYRFSSYALVRYTHYQASIPDRNSYPYKAGNYIIRVYLNGDTSQVAFTKRLLVVDNKVTILAKVTQPFAPEYFTTHQKIQFQIDIKGLNDFNAAQQLKVVVMQNSRWDNAAYNLKPAFIRGNVLEYNSENSAIFPGGKEWRWLDIRDFHLQSDRVSTADYGKTFTNIYLRPDRPLEGQRYIYYRDYNGRYIIDALRGYNPFSEGDYAMVNFYFAPPNGREYTNKDIYLFGELTNYHRTDSLKMTYNDTSRLYETHLFMKQGYYDYSYLYVDHDKPSVSGSFDGNYYETENLYTILVYYKPFGGRADALVGVATFNSRADQPGLSF
ncbi:MAG: DUF5103 domain-containing protein [Ginsengibacter sp.]